MKSYRFTAAICGQAIHDESQGLGFPGENGSGRSRQEIILVEHRYFLLSSPPGRPDGFCWTVYIQKKEREQANG